jgi:DNA-binding transcriptional ArsR family regulator
MTYEQVLSALADPTRRAMYERLRRRPHGVTELARATSVSQPAASQHLAVLRRARLVRHRREGARRIYHATPEGLEALRQYLDHLWTDVLTAFAGDALVTPPRRSR